MRVGSKNNLGGLSLGCACAVLFTRSARLELRRGAYGAFMRRRHCDHGCHLYGLLRTYQRPVTSPQVSAKFPRLVS